MDNWKAWAAFFVSVCVMVVVLAYLDYEEPAIVAIAIPFGLGVICALLGYLRRGREIRHHERMAMIEKGIYIEAKKQDSGVPSLFVVLLVGIGLATVIASDVEFFGFVLLFVGIGLIVRARLQHNKNNAKEVLPPAQSASPSAQPASPPATEDPPAAEQPPAEEEPPAPEKEER
ncbi:MAG: hypothetical protein F4X08_15825 [Gemmatimonadetes bacterium]|nr:hypothetical protein [Gemmatimonadota bacterium]MYD27268.1 hypothetical protein [Gemmatimonadota bacterium]